MQTAIEWLELELLNKRNGTPIIDKALFDRAKEMFEQQIIDAYSGGVNDGCSYMSDGKVEFENEKQYYNQTYGSSNSEKPNDHINNTL